MDEEFREYTTTELVDALEAAGSFDSVEVEVQSPEGHVLFGGLVQLRVTRGHDFDRTGGYTWTRIVARMEPRGGASLIG